MPNNAIETKSVERNILTQFDMLEDTIKDISKFLHDNPEESFKEFKSVKYLTELLKKFDFEICENYMNISTSFMASKGTGHPKVCFLCQYDAIPGKGHVMGNNLSCAASVGAALSLLPSMNNVSGTIILIGCPGELKNGCNNVFVKQGVFDDIDAAFVIRPYTSNGYVNSCDAHLPVKISFECKNNKSNNARIGEYSPKDACLLTLSSVSSLLKGLCSECSINNILYKESEIAMEIETKSIDQANDLNKKIEIISKAIGDCMDLSCTTGLLTMPCHEFINNSTLLRLFAHNLKQNGIINIPEFDSKDNLISCGCISSVVPCISPFISIMPEDIHNVNYGTSEFSDYAASEYAMSQIIIAAKALAFTVYDVLTKQSLLKEAFLNLKLPAHSV